MSNRGCSVGSRVIVLVLVIGSLAKRTRLERREAFIFKVLGSLDKFFLL